MDWDAIRVVLAVARTGSFSGAARLLDVDHTTVSRRLATVERALVVRLFDRTPTGYVATAAAAEILDHAFRMEEEAHALERRLVGRDTRFAGRLRVTISDAVATYLFLPHVAAFRERYPEIDLDLIVGDDARNLGAREADVAVRLTGRAPETLVGRKVANVRYEVYAARHYLAARDDLADVSAVTWIRDDDRPSWLGNFSRSRVALRVDSPMSLVAAVRSGIGLGLLPCFMGEQEPALVRVPTRLAASGWGLWVLSHADLRATARVKVLRDFVVRTLRAHTAIITPAFAGSAVTSERESPLARTPPSSTGGPRGRRTSTRGRRSPQR